MAAEDCSFLLVKASGPISSIAIRTAISTVGSVKSVRPQNGNYIVELETTDPPVIYPSKLTIGDVTLDICPHNETPTYRPGSEGTVYSSELMDCDEETLLQELQDEDGKSQVLSVKQLPSRGQTTNSGRWLLRFKESAPEKVQLKCKLQLDVRLHVRMALRCRNCQEYGHHVDDCKDEPVCPGCSLPVHPDTPCSRVCCPGCGGPHDVRFVHCPRFKYEMDVKRLCISKKIPREEAAALLTTRFQPQVGPPAIARTASQGIPPYPNDISGNVAQTTQAVPSTYANVCGKQSTAQNKPAEQDSKLVQLLTEQTTLLRNIVSTPPMAELIELMNSQTQLLQSIVQQNNEILQAFRDFAPRNLQSTPTTALLPSKPVSASTPTSARTVSSGETVTLSPPPPGKKRRAAPAKQSTIDKPGTKN